MYLCLNYIIFILDIISIKVMFLCYSIQPEGVPKEYSNYVLVDLKNASTFSNTVSLSLPAGVVSGSQRAVFTAIGTYYF